MTITETTSFFVCWYYSFHPQSWKVITGSGNQCFGWQKESLFYKGLYFLPNNIWRTWVILKRTQINIISSHWVGICQGNINEENSRNSFIYKKHMTIKLKKKKHTKNKTHRQKNLRVISVLLEKLNNRQNKDISSLLENAKG